MYKPVSLTPGHGTMKTAFPFIVAQMFATTFETQVINLALPQIQTQFGVTKSTAQWLMTIFYLGTAAGAIPLSRLGDKYGYVYIEMFLTSVCAILYIIQYFIKNFTVLLVFRLMTGIITSGMISNRNTMARVLPSPQNAKKFLEQVIVLMNSLQLITPLLSGIIIDKISWQSCFLFAFGCVVIGVITLLFYTNPSERQKKVRFDIWGSLLLMLTVSAFCLLFTMISEKMYYIALVCIVVSALCGVGFIFVERKHLAPIMPQYIMKNPITAIFGCNIVNYMLTTGISYILPQYASINGISSSRISLIITLSNSMNLICSILVPVLEKRILNRILLVSDYAILMTAAIAMLFLINNRICFIVLIVIMQTSIGLASTILYPITMLSVPPQFGSQVSAIPTTGRTIGQSISYCLFSMLQELVTKSSKKPTAHEVAMVSFEASFAVYIPISFITMFFFWFRIGIQHTEENKRFFKRSCVRQLKDVPLEENALIQNEILAGAEEKANEGDVVENEVSSVNQEIIVSGELVNDENSEDLE